MIDLTCKSCGSSHIVPIVWGSLDDVMRTLHLQDKIALGSCFLPGPGAALWSCVDCSTDLADKPFLWQKDGSAEMQLYRRTVDEIFDQFEPISQEEYARLSGKSWLTTLTRARLSSGSGELLISPTPDGFEVDAGEGVNHFHHHYDMKGAPGFADMIAYVESRRAELASADRDAGVILTMRMSWNDRDFLVSPERGSDSEIKSIVIRPRGGA